MGYRELARRQLLERLYEKMSEDEKRIFVQLTMQNKDHTEIMQALEELKMKADKIRDSQSWWLDLSANIAGSGVYDIATWLLRRFR